MSVAYTQRFTRREGGSEGKSFLVTRGKLVVADAAADADDLVPSVFGLQSFFDSSPLIADADNAIIFVAVSSDDAHLVPFAPGIDTAPDIWDPTLEVPIGTYHITVKGI